MRARVNDNVYSVGDTVKFRVRVTRNVDGTDIAPAEDAEVFVFVEVNGVTVGGRSMTDEDGRSLVKVRLDDHVGAGVADVSVHSHKEIADLPCHWDIEHEYGGRDYPNLFIVR